MVIFIKKVIWLCLATISVCLLLMLNKFNLSNYQFLVSLVALSFSTGTFVWCTLKS